MMRTSRHPAGLPTAAILVFTLIAALGSAARGEEAMKGEEKASVPPPPEEVLSVTSHTVTIAGRPIAYTATAGNYVLKSEDGTPRASFFFVAYRRDGAFDPASRPVLFAFNGGPGSSSVWLHLGLFGPRRVELRDDGQAPPPPYRLVPNGESLLDVADLVFIDPVTTGYSRAVPGVDDKEFHGVNEDIESIGELIHLWVSRNQRWASPKYLAGESYGTLRAAGLVYHLQDRYGMYFNGVILISSILQHLTTRFYPDNPLPCMLFLPTYTATAWYHGRLGPELQAQSVAEVVEEARRFALGEYNLALMQGDALPAEKRRAIAEELARLTGVSPDHAERTDLCLIIFRYVKELLRDESKVVGRLDSRFTATERDAAGEFFEFDPSLAAIRGPYSTLLNDYVRRELGYVSDLPYEILTNRVRPWNYSEYAGRFVDMGEPLRLAISNNPALRVFVGNGYYDLATPFFATEFTFNHLGLAPELRGNVSMHYYEAGHMVYIHRPSREKLRQDLVPFLTGAPAGPLD